jgi:hypothetical protein
MWIIYGVVNHALPVIVANLIVSSLALYSAWRAAQVSRMRRGRPDLVHGPGRRPVDASGYAAPMLYGRT